MMLEREVAEGSPAQLITVLLVNSQHHFIFSPGRFHKGNWAVRIPLFRFLLL